MPTLLLEEVGLDWHPYHLNH
jgi:hypothetical protein